MSQAESSWEPGDAAGSVGGIRPDPVPAQEPSKGNQGVDRPSSFLSRKCAHSTLWIFFRRVAKWGKLI